MGTLVVGLLHFHILFNSNNLQVSNYYLNNIAD